MKKIPKYPRILAISPSTQGFGFALLEGRDVLVDWGVKFIAGDKNSGSISKIREMIAHYEPDVLVLENISGKPFRRSLRVRRLVGQISAIGEKNDIAVLLFSLAQIKQKLLADEKGTNHAVAQMIAEKFADELGFRLPPKRLTGSHQASRFRIFEAVALALMIRKKMGLIAAA